MVERGEGIPAPKTPTDARAEFAATLSPTGQVSAFRATGLAGGRCSPVDPLLAAARELLVAVPASLAAGATWQDSTSAVTCRGEIPVSTLTARNYVVEGLDTLAGTPAIRVRRTSTSTLSGSGTREGEPISLAGTGAGTAVLYLSLTRGALLSATSETRSTLTVETPRGPVAFRQEIEQRVVLER